MYFFVAKIMCLSQSKWRTVLFLILFSISGDLFSIHCNASSDHTLVLKPDIDHYYVGPYLFYLEDSRKSLSIADVSSQQMSGRFVRNSTDLLNLGSNSSAFWIRLTVMPSGSTKKWILSFGWPNIIDHATLYTPQKDSSGWIIKEVGRILPKGPDKIASRPIYFLPQDFAAIPITIYLRVESTDFKVIPLMVMTEGTFQKISNRRSLGLGLYYGIILAMFLYNLILFISLRELNRLYYLLYLLSVGLVFFVANGLFWEFIIPGSALNRSLLAIFGCFAFFWGIIFAKSFLETEKNAPVFDKLLSAFMILSIILAGLVPLVDAAWLNLAIVLQNIIVPPFFLITGIVVLKRGYRPARFFLIAFAALALSVVFEALVTIGVIPYLTHYTSQIGSAIEVILLQLALADRIRMLSKEKEKIQQSLVLAREVQQNLLPHKSPQFEWLDIAGKSIYCDETGGDYYDYLYDDSYKNREVRVAIGDVSGHGISSALLMATFRSYLRHRSTLPGDVAAVISDVNSQIAKDVEDSGQFVTMFFLNIDAANMETSWIRAGHDPAILYDPADNSFQELGGPGVAVGVMEDYQYRSSTKTSIRTNQIILLSTDGIWEARNKKGEMFGKSRIYNIIRDNKSLSANEMINVVLHSLSSFLENSKIEDDITLVIIKIK